VCTVSLKAGLNTYKPPAGAIRFPETRVSQRLWGIGS
jgi:hypothetical protein